MPKLTGRTKAVQVIAAQIDQEGNSWIEVMPTAEKVRNGPYFFTLTRADLDTAVAFIEGHPNELPVDRDHEGAPNVGGSSRAAGWFTGEAKVVTSGEITPQGDTQNHESVWARVKWTPKAQQEIRDGEFRFVSAEWDFAEVNKKTGLMTRLAAFTAATLTNRPFFRGLAPVLAAVVWDSEQGLQFIQSAVYAALNPGAIDNARYWVMDIAIGGDRALVQEYGDPTRTWVIAFTIDANDIVTLASEGEWVEADQQWVTAAKESDRINRGRKPFTPQGDEMDLKVIAKSLGLKEDASEEEVNEAIQAQATAAAKVEDLEAKVAELEKIEPTDESELAKATARVAVLETKLRETEIDTMLAKAVDDGKILPVQKDGLKATSSLSDAAFESVKATLEATPEKTFKPKGSDGPGKNDDDDTPEEKVLASERERFTSDDADVDDESLTQHVKAMALLKEEGKNTPTESEYLSALARV